VASLTEVMEGIVRSLSTGISSDETVFCVLAGGIGPYVFTEIFPVAVGLLRHIAEQHNGVT
jgi:hypothetical protein